MRLIDADAYADEMRKKQNECKAICKSAKTEDERNYWEGIFTTLIEAKLTLEDIPTVDAVPVVRCMDCIYNEDCMNDFFGYGRKDDFFCSLGERKEGKSE